MEPTVVGGKLIKLMQEAPAGSVVALKLSGQVELLPIANPVAMLGFKPLVGTGNVGSALPIFVVCGLSLLVKPIVVDAKLSLGGSAKSIFTTASLLVSGDEDVATAVHRHAKGVAEAAAQGFCRRSLPVYVSI
jgi:hypothetical protein